MQKEPRKRVDNRQEGPGHEMPVAPLFPIHYVCIIVTVLDIFQLRKILL